MSGLWVEAILKIAGSAAKTVAQRATARAERMDSLERVDMLILPGGPGTSQLGEHEGLIRKLKEFHQMGDMLAAICAAPSILGLNGILEGKDATCYPGYEEKLLGAKWLEQPVVVDGNIITSRGMGTAIDFSSAIIAHFLGEEKAQQIEKAIIYR